MNHAGGNNPVEHTFDKGYWERHWEERDAGQGAEASPGNPYVARETADLIPGTALDAGCGEGVEAQWLATQGWKVVGADISAAALSEASARTTARPLTGSGSVTWVEADLTSWQPEQPFDLVMTSYAHPSMPHLEFYRRVAAWVAPGGTLLIVGHLHGQHQEHSQHQGHSQHPPAEATVDLAAIAAEFDSPEWEIRTAEERTRTLEAPDGGHGVELHDVVVKAVRLAR